MTRMLTLPGCHASDCAIGKAVVELAWKLAAEFGYDLKAVEHKRRPHPGGAAGICYQNEGRISIVVRHREGKAWFARPLDWNYVMRVTCHEVAHCHKLDGTRGLMDGPAHREVENKLVAWAVANGYCCLDTD